MTIAAWNDYVAQAKILLGDAPRNPEIAQCISCKHEADCIQARFDSGSSIGSLQWWCGKCWTQFKEYLMPEKKC